MLWDSGSRLYSMKNVNISVGWSGKVSSVFKAAAMIPVLCCPVVSLGPGQKSSFQLCFGHLRRARWAKMPQAKQGQVQELVNLLTGSFARAAPSLLFMSSVLSPPRCSLFNSSGSTPLPWSCSLRTQQWGNVWTGMSEDVCRGSDAALPSHSSTQPRKTPLLGILAPVLCSAVLPCH